MIHLSVYEPNWVYVALVLEAREDFEEENLGEEVFFFLFCFLGEFGRLVEGFAAWNPIDCSKSVTEE